MFGSKRSKSKIAWHLSSIPEKYHVNLSDLMIPKNSKFLGKGNFGQIYLAKYKGQAVAIKTVQIMQKDRSDFVAALKMFIEECEISLQIGRHKHVLHYIGIMFPKKMPDANKDLSLTDLPMLISSYMPNGNLQKYLDNSKLENFNVYKAIVYCTQLANGMKYLHHHKINHADLACRNLLLDSKFILKISDFGLSQKGLEYNYGFAIDQNQYQDNLEGKYQTSRLNRQDGKDNIEVKNLLSSDRSTASQQARQFPIWWAAIEVHENGKITNFSDVWSFGVTAWEIFARGLKPDLELQHLKNNIRLSRPVHCPLAVFMLLVRCWHKDPKERPNFEQIEQALTRFVQTPIRYGLEKSSGCSLYDEIKMPNVNQTLLLTSKQTVCEFSQDRINDNVRANFLGKLYNQVILFSNTCITCRISPKNVPFNFQRMSCARQSPPEFALR